MLKEQQQATIWTQKYYSTNNVQVIRQHKRTVLHRL